MMSLDNYENDTQGFKLNCPSVTLRDCREERTVSEAGMSDLTNTLQRPGPGRQTLGASTERVAWKTVKLGKDMRLCIQGLNKLPNLLWTRKRKISDFPALKTLPGIFPSQFIDESEFCPSLHFATERFFLMS